MPAIMKGWVERVYTLGFGYGVSERDTMTITPLIPFRRRNHGDYDIPAMTLKSGIAPGVVGFKAHLEHQPPSLL